MYEDSVVKELGNRVLGDWKRSEEKRVPDGPGLMLFNPAMPDPGFAAWTVDENELALRMASGPGESRLCWGEIPVVDSLASDLPLQTQSIALVLLSHVLSDGSEPELEEACRLLQPGGVLLVLGLNRNGFRYLRHRSDKTVPGLRPLAVRHRLEQFDMNTRMLLAAGFLRKQWPHNMNSGLARVLIPVADMLLIVARKNEPAIVNPIKQTRLRAVSAPSAMAGS